MSLCDSDRLSVHLSHIQSLFVLASFHWPGKKTGGGGGGGVPGAALDRMLSLKNCSYWPVVVITALLNFFSCARSRRADFQPWG